jgi:hypothetical protein
MFVVGLGLGMVMQVLIVAVQNALPHSQLGTGTAMSSFFRSIGGCVGVALFGAIFNNRLFVELPKYLPPAALQQISGHNISSNPAMLTSLPPAIHHGYVEAFTHALHTVFLGGVPVSVAAFILSWWLKEIPLRDRTYASEEEDPERMEKAVSFS